ncbi:hypothetical protein SISNIDRAFT_482570 [Sistotremastrum niveocremeum HHB9708]|uniref:RNI-like protein n=1 Tax=Sistotremastrum niveocremeum HHB9708 TaxID=1314777 RepID=A0A164YC21_9AGAM|nr:hypothetical protein SISNIDRAFT_482570 [Sistotremastrum niveocremeum HHB9708]
MYSRALTRDIPTLFGNYTPTLSDLYLFGIALDWKSNEGLFSTLKTLFIMDDDPDVFDEIECRELIAHCRSLETLQWSCERSDTTVHFSDIVAAEHLTKIMLHDLTVHFQPHLLRLSSKIAVLDLSCQFKVHGSLDVLFDIIDELQDLHQLTFNCDYLDVKEPLGAVHKRAGLLKLTYLRVGLEHGEFPSALFHLLSSFTLLKLETLDISRSLYHGGAGWTELTSQYELSHLPSLVSLETTCDVVAEVLVGIMRRSPSLHILDLQYRGFRHFGELLAVLGDPVDGDIICPNLSKIICPYCHPGYQEYVEMMSKRNTWANEGRCKELRGGTIISFPLEISGLAGNIPRM